MTKNNELDVNKLLNSIKHQNTVEKVDEPTGNLDLLPSVTTELEGGRTDFIGTRGSATASAFSDLNTVDNMVDMAIERANEIINEAEAEIYDDPRFDPSTLDNDPSVRDWYVKEAKRIRREKGFELPEITADPNTQPEEYKKQLRAYRRKLKSVTKDRQPSVPREIREANLIIQNALDTLRQGSSDRVQKAIQIITDALIRDPLNLARNFKEYGELEDVLLIIVYASDQNDVDVAYLKLMAICNDGVLSVEDSEFFTSEDTYEIEDGEIL